MPVLCLLNTPQCPEQLVFLAHTPVSTQQPGSCTGQHRIETGSSRCNIVQLSIAARIAGCKRPPVLGDGAGDWPLVWRVFKNPLFRTGIRLAQSGAPWNSAETGRHGRATPGSASRWSSVTSGGLCRILRWEGEYGCMGRWSCVRGRARLRGGILHQAQVGPVWRACEGLYSASGSLRLSLVGT
jgi:hypothetical protein